MYHSPFNALKVLNDVYKNSLNDDETIYSPISLINIPLRRHQHAIVEQMKKCELDFSKGVTYENNAIFSKYAILGDNVGVGKTLMVLSHIAQIRQQPALNFTSFHKDSNTNFYTLTKSVNDMSNAGCLVIVPHTLFRQWNDEIVSKTSLKLVALKTKKHVYSENFAKNVSEADIILVSNTLYKDLYSHSNSLNIHWNRIFIDEADSIHITTQPLPTNFYWLITASFVNLLFPQYSSIHISSSVYDLFNNIDTIPNELRCMLRENYNNVYKDYHIHVNTRSLKYLYNILNISHNLRGHTVLRCTEEFIKKSIQLPPLITTIIRCKPSLSHRIVYDVIGGNVRMLLNAGDIKSALEHLGVKTENNQSLIDAVNESKTKELERLQKTYDFKQSLEYSSANAKDSALKNLQEKIDIIYTQMNSLKERIENYKKEVCPICYDEPNDALITNCCSQIFCAYCILTSLSRNMSCPLCRANIHPSYLKKLSTETLVTPTSKEKKKIDAFFDILETNPTGKFLVFSNYDNSFVEVIEGCKSRNICSRELKGSKDSIASTLHQFKDGKVNCLLLNAMHIGAGLTITDATHVILLHAVSSEIEKQILGRAYRDGRKDELHFIKLLHPDEVS
jgi:hypothetical protein